MSTLQTLRTPISHEFNLKNGARLADFHGWNMPTFYSSIIEEHKATRENIGLFDVSHMGRWWITGKDAEKFLNYITTNDLAKIPEGKGIYTTLCNEEGGIIDDLIIYKINPEKFLLVDNAGNHESDGAWYRKQQLGFDVKLEDIISKWGQIAIQGPKAKAAVEKLLCINETLKYFTCKEAILENQDLVVAATGYTGEKGYELYGPPKLLMQIWQTLINDADAKPCGLGSRDLLRLEAGYCLHGNDIDPNTTPYEAGLNWVVKLDKADFIAKTKVTRKNKKLVGLKFPESEKIIPRSHMKVSDLSQKAIGEISSGNYSFMLNRGIALAYIQPDYSDQEALVEIRGKYFKAEVSEPWFYRNI